jgi:hypothetical protein
VLNFFCLSNKIEDNIYAAAITSAIAKKGFKCTLFVREIPYFAERYDSIKITADLPRALSRTRRSIHNDIVYDQYDENKQYINVWLNQLRGSFICESIDKTLLSVAKHVISTLGVRKRITVDNIISSSSSKYVNVKVKHQATGLIKVCVPAQTITKFENEISISLSQIFSGCSRAAFYIFCDNQRYRSNNCKSFIEINTFISAMIDSDVIILSSPVFILPYINIIKKQKLLFLSSIDKSNKVKNKADFLPNATADSIIRYLRTLY